MKKKYLRCTALVCWVVVMLLTGNTAWTLAPNLAQVKITAFDGAAQDYFGVAVAVTGDGSYVATGACRNNQDTGAVYIYRRDGKKLKLLQKLIPPPGYTQEYFGCSVGLSKKGSYLVVGAETESNRNGVEAGAVYVYEHLVSTSSGIDNWVLKSTLLASDGEQGDQFGWDVDVTENNTVVVGAIDDDGQGSAYVFEWDSNSSSYSQTKLYSSGRHIDSNFGNDVALSPSGKKIVVGEPSATKQGAAYLYERTGGGWTFRKKFIAVGGTTDDRFGSSVDIAENDLVVVGTGKNKSGPGTAHVFRFIPIPLPGPPPSVIWKWIETTLTPANAGPGMSFGQSVSVTSKSETKSSDIVVVGAPAWNSVNSSLTSPGAAYVYEKTGGGWGTARKITAFDGAADNLFGIDVAVAADGKSLASGAAADTVNSNKNQGSAYLILLEGPWPVEHPQPDLRCNITIWINGLLPPGPWGPLGPFPPEPEPYLEVGLLSRLEIKRAGLEEQLQIAGDRDEIWGLVKKLEVLDLGMGMAEALQSGDEFPAGELGRHVLLAAIDVRLSEIDAHFETAGSEGELERLHLEKELLELDREFVEAELMGDGDRADELLGWIRELESIGEE